MALLLVDVEVEGTRLDVRLAGATVTEMGPDLEPLGQDEGESVIDGHGGALIPGLWDHHLHLLALAASYDSVVAGPPQVNDADQLREALAEADATLEPGRWLRGIGYHEVVAGALDRDALDQLVPDRPARIQHRSGAQWTLNSAAIDALGLADRRLGGIEREDRDRPTGRLFGLDRLLQEIEPRGAPSLDGLGRQLASFGITGVTDATATPSLDYFAPLADAVRSGALPFQVVVTGGPGLDPTAIPAELGAGPAKIVIADHALPTLADLTEAIEQARRHGRAVALHCVTRVALVLALAALGDAGSIPGDRIEHGAVIPDELVDPLRRLDLTVVTQPAFVADRGDEYAATVDDEKLEDLYPAARLIRAGVAVAGSSDAPFGSSDPWHSIWAAVHRRTASGLVLGPLERLDPARALALFLGPSSAPGAPSRVVGPGRAADLCLLDRPLSQVLRHPDASQVAATICRGQLTFRREDQTR